MGIAATGTGVQDSHSIGSDADELLDLGDQITTLAAQLHAGTHRLLVMLAEFDDRGGWRAGGHRSCADWLAFHTGFDKGACREKVRAARALIGLPLTSQATARGELSFAKVRALTRVATPDNESALLDFARAGSAAQTERLVRSWKMMSRRDEQDLERMRHESRTLSIVPDDDGMYVVRGRLDPEVGALLMRALDAASDALYAEDPSRSNGRLPADQTTPRQRRADAIGLLAERALSAGMAGADNTPVSGSRAHRYQVMLHVEASTLGEASEPGMSDLSDGTRVSAETSRRLACDAGIVSITKDSKGDILDVGRRTRTIPPALRRALEVRDRGCRFPGCGLRFTDAHHVKHWADGGATRLDNLILLCRHHHRLVHEEGWRVRTPAGELPEFVSPTGHVIRRGPATHRGLGMTPVADLEEENRRSGASPEWNTAMGRWKGDVDEAVRAAAWEALDC